MFGILANLEGLAFVFSESAAVLLRDGRPCGDVFADARSAAFFAFGKITQGQRAVLAILETELPHVYTALTEAFLQKKPLPVVLLRDGRASLKDVSFLKNCGTDFAAAKSGEELRMLVENSLSKTAPAAVLADFDAAPPAPSAENLRKITAKVAGVLGEGAKVFWQGGLYRGGCGESEGLECQYGLVAKYIGWCAAQGGKSILVLSAQQLARDLNSLNLRYVCGGVKMLVVQTGGVPESWLEGNGFRIVRVGAAGLEAIAENIGLPEPAVFIVNGYIE